MKIRKVEIHIFYEVEDSFTHVTRRWQHGLYCSTVSRCPSSMHSSIHPSIYPPSVSIHQSPPRPVPPSPLASTRARSGAVDAADWNRLRLVLNAAPGEDNNILRTAIRDSRQQSAWAPHFVFSLSFLLSLCLFCSWQVSLHYLIWLISSLWWMCHSPGCPPST